MKTPLLSADELGRLSSELPQWTIHENRIQRKISYPYVSGQSSPFMKGLFLIERIAALAERADHHPDIQLTYPFVLVELTTHDSGGLTAKDVALAKEIDAIV